MNCFPCFQSQRSNKRSNSTEQLNPPDLSTTNDPRSSPPPTVNIKSKQPADVKNKKDEGSTVETGDIAAKNFTFRELAAATKNFRQEFLLGEGGFGRVYKGTLQPSGQVVAVKQLDRNGTQGNKEFLVEVSALSLLNHENLLNLVGYCADGDQRLLVYDYMPLGSLEDQLLEVKTEKKPLDWQTRMKIASGAAQGLEYLHEKANPAVIYRDLKSSNILLDVEFNPKLSDFGLEKLGPAGNNKTHISPRVIGSYGYSAPEYESKGELTLKSDIYSFGVVLLELLSGRRAIDTARPIDEQNLVAWAQPIFKDPKRFPEMADPLLERHFPVRSLNQAVGIAAMCLQEEPAVRPLISDVVAALSFLTLVPDEPTPPPSLPLPAAVDPPTIPLSDDTNKKVASSCAAGEKDKDSGAHDGHGSGNNSDRDDDSDGDSSNHSDGDHHSDDEVGSDHDDGDSRSSSDRGDEDDDEEEEWDSVNHNDEDNSADERQKEVKKSITWNLNSVQKRKLENEDEEDGNSSVSSSSRSNNSIVEPQPQDGGVSGSDLAHKNKENNNNNNNNMNNEEGKSILEHSDSRCSSKSGSFDGSFRSSSDRSSSSNILNSGSISYTDYQVGCGDSNLMHSTSCMKSLNGNIGSKNCSCNNNSNNILFQDESVSSY